MGALKSRDEPVWGGLGTPHDGQGLTFICRKDQ